MFQLSADSHNDCTVCSFKIPNSIRLQIFTFTFTYMRIYAFINTLTIHAQNVQYILSEPRQLFKCDSMANAAVAHVSLSLTTTFEHSNFKCVVSYWTCAFEDSLVVL